MTERTRDKFIDGDGPIAFADRGLCTDIKQSDEIDQWHTCIRCGMQANIRGRRVPKRRPSCWREVNGILCGGMMVVTPIIRKHQ